MIALIFIFAEKKKNTVKALLDLDLNPGGLAGLVRSLYLHANIPSYKVR